MKTSEENGKIAGFALGLLLISFFIFVVVGILSDKRESKLCIDGFVYKCKKSICIKQIDVCEIIR